MPKMGMVDRAEVDADIATHAALDTGVHGAGSDTLATDADIATHAALATGVHGVGAGTIVGTGLTQTLTSKTLTSPTIQGTVAAGTGLTLPAHISGDVTIGANQLIYTDIRLKQITAALLGIRNLADNAYLGLILDTVSCQSVFSLAAAGAFTTGNDDNDYIVFKSRDSGVGLVEVARLVGAADPYWSFDASQGTRFTNAGKICFFTGSPVSQQLKASHNNWAALSDVVSALVNLGLLDQA